MKLSWSEGCSNKIHISVDGEYIFSVDAEYWYSSKWCRVKEIDDPEEEERFYNENGSRCAFISGLRILSYCDNSRKDLRRKLISKSHKAQYVDSALDSLEKYGYIDDRRFAASFAQRLIRTKHTSRNGIKFELVARGISREIADEILDEIEFNPADDIAELLNGKYKRYLNDEKGLKKTVAGLQRLGYNWSDINNALNNLSLKREDDFSD